MARNFVAASSQYLSVVATPLTDFPITWSCWYQNVDNVQHPLTSIAGLTTSRRQALWHDPSAVFFTSGATASCTASSGTNVWLHAAGVASASNSRAVYSWDGTTAYSGTNTDNIAWHGYTIVSIGAVVSQFGVSGYHNGKIAEVGLWNVALTDDEIDILRAGFSPLCVRPASLVGYWPLMGSYSPEIDLVGRYEMTLTNAPTEADHCRIILPPPRMLAGVPDAAVATRRTMMLMGCGA